MAAGRAVVASRIGQVAEVVVDGVTGVLFEPGDRCAYHGLGRAAGQRETPCCRVWLRQTVKSLCFEEGI